MNEYPQIIFPKGMMLKKRSEKTPEWIKLSISFKADEFIKFLEEHQNLGGWLTIDLKEKKGEKGNYYFALNTFKPESRAESGGNSLEI